LQRGIRRVDVEDDDIRAEPGQLAAGFETDTARAARDVDDLVCKVNSVRQIRWVSA
jgi:hypothetical protein